MLKSILKEAELQLPVPNNLLLSRLNSLNQNKTPSDIYHIQLGFGEQETNYVDWVTLYGWNSIILINCAVAYWVSMIWLHPLFMKRQKSQKPEERCFLHVADCTTGCRKYIPKPPAAMWEIQNYRMLLCISHFLNSSHK